MPCSQRKYVDLIYKISSKWVNWDPPIGIQVGTYGTVNKETGDLLIEGNIYSPEFQLELDKQGINIRLADFPPQDGAVEDDFIVASRGAKRRELAADLTADAPGIASASVKGQWLFERGKRDAILIMQKPRLIHLPNNVILENLYHVEKLTDKWLVTSVHMCPAYSMYLSDKTGDKVSLALMAQAPITGAVGATTGASGGFTWWVDAQTGLLRKACDQTGNYVYAPLYTLKRPISRFWGRLHRGVSLPEPKGDDLWYNCSPPWDPLDEDGVEDPLDSGVRATDQLTYLTGDASTQRVE